MNIETLRSWLNGSRDYRTGVVLFQEWCTDLKRLQVLAKYHNKRNAEWLADEIRAEFDRLKESAGSTSKPAKKTPVRFKEPDQQKHNPLYEECRQEAIKAYKLVMRKRSKLLELTEAEDVNNTLLIERRAPLALEIIKEWIRVSSLFERADFVKAHGKLPDGVNLETQEDFAFIADSDIPATLIRLKNNLRKTRSRPVSEQRLKRIAELEDQIKKLQQKWDSLN